MPPNATTPGFGLGLRTAHYNDFLAAPQAVDWLEIITDNFLVEGGKPLVMLDRIRRDYPMAMHGVAMNLGASQGLCPDYLKRVKALADRVQPMWVSDHLCWTGTAEHTLHDLYPLPYTDEAARRVIAHIRQAQELLQRRLVLENVSSYVRFKDSACAEWQFLAHIAQEADCDLLLDVNNVYVSSVNHGFDPLHYLNALPRQRIRQIHLAGHSDHGSHIVDTHDAPVADAVWALYEAACARFAPVATMIERDDNIPPLAELVAELGIARHKAAKSATSNARLTAPSAITPSAATTLTVLQTQFAQHVLNRAPATHVLPLLDGTPGPLAPPERGLTAEQGLAVYAHAYTARLAEVLGECHARTRHYMGDEAFNAEAHAFALSHPPTGCSLNRYGAPFAQFLAQQYPANPELSELAQLDWDLRACFDGPDVAALDASTAASDAEGLWLMQSPALHPSLLLRPITRNVVALWRALNDDTEVPPPALLDQPTMLAVWRQGLQPHFRTVHAEETTVLAALQQPGATLASVAENLGGSSALPSPASLTQLLQTWWVEGWLRLPASASANPAMMSATAFATTA